jgi:glycosyltransferase involved in cell wall biosynthesis
VEYHNVDLHHSFYPNSSYLRRMQVVVTVSNDLCTDQRVQKVCKSIIDRGHSVMLIGRLLPASLPLNLPYKTKRFKLWFNTGPLFYINLNLRLFIFLLFTRCDAIHSNDLDTLLPSWLVAGMCRKMLVYDTHEYFTGVPELQKRPLVRGVWTFIEGLIFPKLKRVITVNDSIADLYQNRYGNTEIQVIRNIPNAEISIVSNQEFSTVFPPGKFRIILQGNGINVDRGGEEAIEMMKWLDRAVLIIAGNGDVIQQLKENVISEKLEDRVIFMPRMPYNELLGLTQLCDLGLTLDKDTNINYRFSLPNKLFDYLRAGIPVLASDLTEVRKIVETYHTGWIVEKVDPQLMANQINEFIDNPDVYLKVKTNLTEASKQLSWEKECQVLDKWYGPRCL